MKIDALEHPKTYDFAARLRVGRAQAIGHLELLWTYTGKHSPQGDLGKWPDGAIARACEWQDDPQEFITALIEARLVDLDITHRLVVHDWQDHCQTWVRAKLKQGRLSFITPSPPSIERTIVPTIVATIEGTKAPTTRARVPSQAKRREAYVGDAHTPERPIVGTAVGTGPNPDPTPKPATPAIGCDHAQAFAAVRAAYPHKAGRVSWIPAEHHWRIRLDEGVTVEQLLDGVRRYAAYVAAGGVSGPEFVLGPEKFFGDVDKPWSMPWARPARANGKESFETIHARLTAAGADDDNEFDEAAHA